MQEDGGKKGKAKIPEKSMFHGKEERDNLGRSWMDPPREQRSEVEQAFLPKRWIHTWSGHTKGVNAIRYFPQICMRNFFGTCSETLLLLWIMPWILSLDIASLLRWSLYVSCIDITVLIQKLVMGIATLSLTTVSGHVKF